MSLCEMKDLKKTYQMGEIDVDVLKGINLRIDEGEFVAIIGASGSGKTTLLNIIGCLDQATCGHYILAGKEVTELNDDELSAIRNEHIGFVFQSFYLMPYATVYENVMLPSLYAHKRKHRFEKRAGELLSIVGLADRAKFKPNQLSGGQQQRVAIARALINEPDLILADEPTGQLDSKTAGEIMNLIVELNNHGKTVIIVTHDQHIASYAKRVIEIKDGIIV